MLTKLGKHGNYPVTVVSQHDELIARIDCDATWSVKWNEVAVQAHEPATDDNIAISAVCRLLLAGRDNFLTSDWRRPAGAWRFQSFSIVTCPSNPLMAPFALIGTNETIAWVNQSGIWSVNWQEVGRIQTVPDHSHWAFVAIDGFCRLLLAAKDNFITEPFSRED